MDAGQSLQYRKYNSIRAAINAVVLVLGDKKTWEIIFCSLEQCGVLRILRDSRLQKKIINMYSVTMEMEL